MNPLFSSIQLACSSGAS